MRLSGIILLVSACASTPRLGPVPDDDGASKIAGPSVHGRRLALYKLRLEDGRADDASTRRLANALRRSRLFDGVETVDRMPGGDRLVLLVRRQRAGQMGGTKLAVLDDTGGTVFEAVVVGKTFDERVEQMVSALEEADFTGRYMRRLKVSMRRSTPHPAGHLQAQALPPGWQMRALGTGLVPPGWPGPGICRGTRLWDPDQDMGSGKGPAEITLYFCPPAYQEVRPIALVGSAQLLLVGPASERIYMFVPHAGVNWRNAESELRRALSRGGLYRPPP